MNPFPEEISSKILSKLPVKSVLRAKRWSRVTRDFIRDLTCNPTFVDEHMKFSTQRNPNLILTDTICGGEGNIRNSLYFVQDEEAPDQYSCHKVNLEIAEFQEFRVMGSCNGLICLVHPTKRYEICICNPCTGEHIKIPPPVSMEDIPGDIVVGFGVIPMTNKYKVLAIIDFPEPSDFIPLRQKVFVYTLGDTTWRFKDNTSVLRLGQSACKAFVNGALHWVSNARQIVSFDMATEELDIILRPQLELGSGSFSLRAFKGKLLILNTSFADRIEMWVMNDYRVVESWTHIFTINEQQIGRNIRNVEIVCFLEDWKVLMVYDHRALLRYNLRTASVSELSGIDGLPNRFDAVAHVGTLVSPLLRRDREM
ncbi:F-box protein At3g07870-like [Rhododendron vialii]|uniref:F-box protein At3g07870-like n=1 Tax=Rhododendron vialii TaxID=182163 RepID=UPI00265F4716|nr:F-box protein At3g07870-like [Rhododendron vialii]